MKRWIVAALVLAIVLMLAGCSKGKIGKIDAEQIADAETNNRMFMVVSNEWGGSVLVDKATGVMYWMSNWDYNAGTLTLLINADGTPRIWEG